MISLSWRQIFPKERNMTDTRNLQYPDFVNAVFKAQGVSIQPAAEHLLHHALRGMIRFVHSQESGRLDSAYHQIKPLDKNGRPTFLANPLRRLVSDDLDAIEYDKYVILHEQTMQGELFPGRLDPQGMDEQKLAEFLSSIDEPFLGEEALPQALKRTVAIALNNHLKKMPPGLQRHLKDHRVKIAHDYCLQSTGCEAASLWQRYATQERAWLVERFMQTLHNGPIKNSLSPESVHWEEVLRLVSKTYELLLYYFVGLMVDGLHGYQFAVDLAEILHHFHKHPILGLRKTKPEAWCMLVG
jgi:hypothetical protein